MNIPAVQHHAGYPDVYLASRKRLVVTIHAAAGDIKTCELLVFPRTGTGENQQLSYAACDQR